MLSFREDELFLFFKNELHMGLGEVRLWEGSSQNEPHAVPEGRETVSQAAFSGSKLPVSQNVSQGQLSSQKVHPPCPLDCLGQMRAALKFAHDPAGVQWQ